MVALLAVVSAALGVVTPSHARIAGRDRSHRASTSAESAAAADRPHAKRSRRPYKPPVARNADDPAATQASWPQA